MLILSFMLPQLEVCQVRSPGDLLSALFRFQASPRYLDFHSASHGQIDDAPSHPANVNMILFGFFDWIFCIETRIRIYHLAELDWLLYEFFNTCTAYYRAGFLLHFLPDLPQSY